MNAALRKSAIVAALLMLGVSTGAGQNYKIVAHLSTDAGALSRAEVSRLFLKKSLKWPDGSYVVPVDLPVGSATRDAFSRDVHGKTTAAVDAFWQKQVFTGRGLPPVTKPSDADVVEYIRNTPGAVGYVGAGAQTGGLKIIKVQ
jgi:ABC-type phosphate transport system substrate-binding protein